jgi:hypothetical protein
MKKNFRNYFSQSFSFFCLLRNLSTTKNFEFKTASHCIFLQEKQNHFSTTGNFHISHIYHEGSASGDKLANYVLTVADFVLWETFLSFLRFL